MLSHLKQRAAAVAVPALMSDMKSDMPQQKKYFTVHMATKLVDKGRYTVPQLVQRTQALRSSAAVLP